MKKAVTKVKAKINLTLDVIGNYNGYHKIESLVASINLYDKIIVKRRNDSIINLKQKGIIVGGKKEDNNAVKSAKKFIEKYDTGGVDILIKKHIPLGGGLGGSSADIAGVIKGMKKLYGIEENLEEIANELGSDVTYMLNGGFALLEGKGEKITPFTVDKKIYLILLIDKGEVTSKESYDKFDELYEGHYKEKSVSKKCMKYLTDKKYNKFIALAENDLYIPSSLIYDKIKYNIKLLEKVNPEKALMSGSGATTYAIFFDKKKRNKAYRNLIKTVDKNLLIKAETI